MALIHPRNDTTPPPHALSTPSPPTPPPTVDVFNHASHNRGDIHLRIDNNNINNDDDNEGWDDLDFQPLEQIFNRSPLSLSDSSSASDPGDYFQLPIDRHTPLQKQKQRHHHHHQQKQHPPHQHLQQQQQQQQQQFQHLHNKGLPPNAVHRPRAAPPRPLMNRAGSQPSAAVVATTFLPTPVTPTPPSRLRPRPVSSVSSASTSSSVSASASASASAPVAASSSFSASSSATASVEASPTSDASSQDSLEAARQLGQDRPLPDPDPETETVPASPGATEAATTAAPSAVVPSRSASAPAPAAPGSLPPSSLQRQNSFKLPTYSGTITRIYAQHNKKEVVNDWADDMQLPSEGFHFSRVRAVLAARSSKAPHNADEEALALMDEAMGLSHPASSSALLSLATTPLPAAKNHTAYHASASASAASASASASAAANTKDSALAVVSPTSLLARRPLSSPPASPSASVSASISTSPALTTTAVYANATLVGVACDAAQALKKSVSTPAMETIETLDEDFDLSEDLNPMELVLKWRRGLQPNTPTAEGARWHGSPESEVEEIDFGTPIETNSLASSASLSRDATTTTTTSAGMAAASLISDEENIMEGIEFPETMDRLQLVTEHARQASQALYDLKKKRSEEFWDGIELGGEDESLPLHRRNKHVVVRDGPSMAERRQSRVCREEVPLKDFVAAPSKIPRLTRPRGDFSRPVSPTPTLSRSHSTHLDLPLVQDTSRSSLPRPTRGSMRSRTMDLRGYLALSMPDGTIASSVQSTPFGSRAPTPTIARLSFQLQEHTTTSATTTTTNSSKDESGVDNGKEKQDEDVPAFPSLSMMDHDKKSYRPATHHTGRRALEGLRSLAGRFGPKINKRREIPSFDNKAALPPLPTASSNASIGRAAAGKQLTVDVMKRPSFSRSSSFTDWETELDLDDLPAPHQGTNGGGRHTQETGDGRLSCVSTVSEAKSVASSTMGMFPKRVFLRRGSKYDTFGDGSELERFDNLPTFEKEDASSPSGKPDVSRMPKSKSIRRSLFDIFGQNTEPTVK
ncbi:hypothetical protein DFQ26_000384, partial [Actinomortierella ambigua]